MRKLSDRTNQASNDITQIVSKVNDSVKDISLSLTENLKKTKSKKETVGEAVKTLIGTAKESTEIFSELVDSVVASSESVAHNIDQIIMSLQFQDITRKEIEAAGLPLTQIGNLAEDMVSKLTHVVGSRSYASQAPTPPSTNRPTLAKSVQAPVTSAKPQPTQDVLSFDSEHQSSTTPKVEPEANEDEDETLFFGDSQSVGNSENAADPGPKNGSEKTAAPATDNSKQDDEDATANSGDVLFF